MGIELANAFYKMRVKADRHNDYNAAYAFSCAEEITLRYPRLNSEEDIASLRAQLQGESARALPKEKEAWFSILALFDKCFT